MSDEKQKLESIWDKVAPEFGKAGPAYWSRFGKRLVELSEIKSGALILDIAMGRGASLFPAAERAGKHGHVIGIDISEVMVSETCNEILEKKIKNAEVMNMDAARLEFEDGVFDNVICGFGIGYLLMNGNGMSEESRVIKNGGQAAFSIWAKQEDQRWLTDIFNKYFHAEPKVTDSNNQNIPKFETVADVEKILVGSGFVNVRVFQESNDVVYKSKEEWWQEMQANAVRRIFEAIDESGENKLKECREEIFEGIESFKKEDGYHFNMPVIYAFGNKNI